MFKTTFVAVALLLCTACPGPDHASPASLSGSIGGQPMVARDAVSTVLRSGSSSEGAIVITNASNTCQKMVAGQQPRNAQAIFIEIGTQGTSGTVAPSAPGTYVVHSHSDATSASGNVAVVSYGATDASCHPSASFEGVSGTVTLTAVGANGYAGTFEVTFSGGAGRVTGSFSGDTCTSLSLDPNAACQ